MSNNSKSSIYDTPNAAKGSPATPRSGGKTRAAAAAAKPDSDSASPLQNARSSLDKSPRTTAPKKPVPSRSPSVSTPPDRKTSHVSRSSEIQSQLDIALESLKDAKEMFVSVEKEKEEVLEELRLSQRLAEEANERLREALMAQKRAVEDSEIEKFRAVEMEQASIEAVRQKEEEWRKELEMVRDLHAVDVSALLTATQELQKVRQELAMTSDAKNQAMNHAEEATKIAEVNLEKAEALSAELLHLKSMFGGSRTGAMEIDNSKLQTEAKLELESLRQELEEAKKLEVKLAEKDAALEQLNVDLEAAKMAESYARNLADELHQRSQELASQAERAKRLETTASESLESVTKQLERSNAALLVSESEIAALKEEVELLKTAFNAQKTELEELEHYIASAKHEASEMSKKVESLSLELEAAKEEKMKSLDNEKLASATVQTLLEEKRKLIDDLQSSKDEEEKSKKALESLASALDEVSAEARDAKEKLFSSHESYETQIEELKLALKSTNEKYESLLDAAKSEIQARTSTDEQAKHEFRNSKAEWEEKELLLVKSLKESDEEKGCLENEVNRLLNVLKTAEEEASAAMEEQSVSSKEADREIISLKGALSEAKAESMRLQERAEESLLDKENELQKSLEQNNELQRKESSLQKRVEELSKLLEEALSKLQEKENGEPTDSEKDYDVLPKVEQNGTEGMKPSEVEGEEEEEAVVKASSKVEAANGEVKDSENERGDSESAEVDLKTWESFKIEENEMNTELEAGHESFEDEADSKAEDLADSYDQVNGIALMDSDSPSKQSSNGQKKKKALFSKFGNMLKKKSSPSSLK